MVDCMVCAWDADTDSLAAASSPPEVAEMMVWCWCRAVPGRHAGSARRGYWSAPGSVCRSNLTSVARGESDRHLLVPAPSDRRGPPHGPAPNDPIHVLHVIPPHHNLTTAANSNPAHILPLPLPSSLLLRLLFLVLPSAYLLFPCVHFFLSSESSVNVFFRKSSSIEFFHFVFDVSFVFLFKHRCFSALTLSCPPNPLVISSSSNPQL